MSSGVTIHAALESVAGRCGADGTAVPPSIGEDGWVKRPVRRGFVVLLPYALAVAIVYGMVASALAVPLAHRGNAADAATGSQPGCRIDAGVDHADVPIRLEPRPEGDAAGRAARNHDHHAHAGHAGAAATTPAPTPPADGDRRPSPDHFDCCTARLGTVGTPALALTLVRRLEVEPRRVRTPRPRMPSRPRPWRVSLGRQPPAPALATTLAA
jgi:hypothetical protein